jgi:hypothetical protein
MINSRYHNKIVSVQSVNGEKPEDHGELKRTSELVTFGARGRQYFFFSNHICYNLSNYLAIKSYL